MAVPAARAVLGRNPTLPPGGLPGARVLVSGASGLPVSPVRVGVGLSCFLASDGAWWGPYSTLGSKHGRWTATGTVVGALRATSGVSPHCPTVTPKRGRPGVRVPARPPRPLLRAGVQSGSHVGRGGPQSL